jgi:hypothetical protein
MKITKSLMLAGFAALSIGVGSAMAQSETPSMSTGDYWSAKAAAAQRAAGANVNQSGSPDVDTMRSGATKSDPHRYDWGTLANPG